MDPLRLPISWLLLRLGITEYPVPVRTLVVALGDTLTVFISIGIGLLATFQFTTGGYLKTHVDMGAVPMTLSYERTVRTSCKSPTHVETPSAVAW